jgi:predicted ATP-grasp superfamily ATP-dependent carboligase
MRPAVVIGTHTMGLGVIRSLGMRGVPIFAVHYDEKDMGYTSKYVTENYRSPHPGESDELFVEWLEDNTDLFANCILFPVSDAALSTLSRYKTKLNEKYVVACTEWEISQQFIQKRYTYTLAESIGVPLPKTTLLSSEKDLVNSREDITYPCLVKPDESHQFFEKFDTKMVQVENFAELEGAYHRAAAVGLKVMLQEFIPGEDTLGVNYNSYFWDNRPVVEFTAQQIRNAPPIFGSPSVALSKNYPEVLESGRKILTQMGFYGYSCIEFKCDPRDGIYKLIEVNGRHNLSTLLAVRCGINFPWLHYNHLINGEVPSAMDYQVGIFWIDILRDMPYAPKHIKLGESLADLIRPYLLQKVFAVFDVRDPVPFIHRSLYLLRRALKGASRLLNSVWLSKFNNRGEVI